MNFVYLYIFLINMKKRESKTLPVAVGKVLKSSVINTIQYNTIVLKGMLECRIILWLHCVLYSLAVQMNGMIIVQRDIQVGASSRETRAN